MLTPPTSGHCTAAGSTLLPCSLTAAAAAAAAVAAAAAAAAACFCPLVHHPPYHIVYNVLHLAAPTCHRGGILADDMVSCAAFEPQTLMPVLNPRNPGYSDKCSRTRTTTAIFLSNCWPWISQQFTQSTVEPWAGCYKVSQIIIIIKIIIIQIALCGEYRSVVKVSTVTSIAQVTHGEEGCQHWKPP